MRPRVGTLGTLGTTPGRPEGSRGAPARRREAAQPRRRLRRRVHEDVTLVLGILGLVLANLVVPPRRKVFAPPGSVHTDAASDSCADVVGSIPGAAA